jgi:hypothetical protein
MFSMYSASASLVATVLLILGVIVRRRSRQAHERTLMLRAIRQLEKARAAAVCG